MATSKRNVHPSRTGQPASDAASAPASSHQGDHPRPCHTTQEDRAILLASLLTVGADRVYVDEAEDDELHGIAELIDPS